MDITSSCHRGADTSVLAYASVPEKHRSKVRHMILEKIQEMGKASCSDLESALALSHQTCSARITELSKSGCIVDTKIRKHTPRGRLERVYSVAPELTHRVTQE